MHYQLCMPGVKKQTVKRTYDDLICYAGTVLAELVSSVPRGIEAEMIQII